jgi:hypothetical protein
MIPPLPTEATDTPLADPAPIPGSNEEQAAIALLREMGGKASLIETLNYCQWYADNYWRLRGVIADLRRELAKCRKESAALITGTEP